MVPRRALVPLAAGFEMMQRLLPCHAEPLRGTMIHQIEPRADQGSDDDGARRGFGSSKMPGQSAGRVIDRNRGLDGRRKFDIEFRTPNPAEFGIHRKTISAEQPEHDQCRGKYAKDERTP